MARKLTKGQLWYRSLSPEEKAKYIAQKERQRERRRQTGTDSKTGKREKLPDGSVRIWEHRDKFTVYRPFMLDSDGNPLDKWL